MTKKEKELTSNKVRLRFRPLGPIDTPASVRPYDALNSLPIDKSPFDPEPAVNRLVPPPFRLCWNRLFKK
jgi:hypothetical protein